MWTQPDLIVIVSARKPLDANGVPVSTWYRRTWHRNCEQHSSAGVPPRRQPARPNIGIDRVRWAGGIGLGDNGSSVGFVPGSVSTTRKSVLSLTSRPVRTSEPRQLRIRSLGSGKYSHQLFVIVTR